MLGYQENGFFLVGLTSKLNFHHSSLGEIFHSGGGQL